MSFTKQQVELKVQKGIRQAEDDLVILIENALNTTSYGNLEESQFRNLVRVSDTTESPEVIKNFLRYQVGRDDKWGNGQNSLAEKIIKNIDGSLKESAQKICKENADSEVKAIWLELIRRYLGYGARHLKYLNSTEEGKKLRAEGRRKNSVKS